MNSRATLTTGDVKTILFNKTIPMVFGILGLIVFNIVDTYFVSRLGTGQLAALTFTFPVVLVLNSVALGIGTGTVAALSRVIGKGDTPRIKRIATDSLSLGLVVVFVFVVFGLLTIKPLFTMLGATSEVMPYIESYMRIWYLGVLFVVIPMVGNNSIRAMGDTKTPGLVMMIAAVVNIILDPILIFGLGPFPRLEVAGAAIATVIARMTTFTVALYVLIIREKVVELKKVPFDEVLESWKTILFIGLPNAMAKVIMPIGIGIITGLMARESIEAVAGYGVAAKIERFATLFVISLSVVMTPFVGQNLGAQKFDRIRESIRLSYGFSIISSLILYGILSIASKPIGALFSKDPQVINVVVLYLMIVPLGYGFQGIQHISISILNALHKPFQATGIAIMQMFIIYVPLAIIGSKLAGIKGVFAALVISYVISSVVAIRTTYYYLKYEKNKIKKPIDKI